MILFTYGTKYVGKIDRINGVGYSVSKVIHIAEIPLFPLDGYWVIEGSESKSIFGGVKSFRGFPVSSRWRSFGWAWIRIFLFWLGMAFLLGLLPILFTLLGLPDYSFGYPLGFALGGAAIAVLWLTRKGLPCTPKRVKVLRSLINDATESNN